MNEQPLDCANPRRLSSKRILVAARSLLVRRAIADECRIAGYEVAAEASSCEQLLSAARAHDPHVIILDFIFSDGDVLANIDLLCGTMRVPRIVVVCSTLDSCSLLHFAHHAIKGIVWQETSTANQVSVVLGRVLSGGSYYCGEVLEKMKREKANTRPLRALLSRRDWALLSLIGGGYTDREISPLLGISQRTAEGHRSKLMKKVGVDGTPKLMAFAIENGFTLWTNNTLLFRYKK